MLSAFYSFLSVSMIGHKKFVKMYADHDAFDVTGGVNRGGGGGRIHQSSKHLHLNSSFAELKGPCFAQNYFKNYFDFPSLRQNNQIFFSRFLDLAINHFLPVLVSKQATRFLTSIYAKI